MRFLGILGLSVAALLGGACGDDKPGAIVDDGISWHVRACEGGAGCGSYFAHIQAEEDENFRVSCSIGKTSGLRITLSDPGFPGDGIKPQRPPSTLTIENADVATQNCNVTLQEASMYQFARETWRGGCPRSGSGCTLTGGPRDGWDFVGTLFCDAILNTRNNLTYELGSGTAPGAPIEIAVDNCN